MVLVEFPSVQIPGRSPPPPRPRAGSPTVIAVQGEHDISTVAVLAADLARAIGSADADLSLDLSEVRFMDASTVTVILLARRFLDRRQHTLTLRSPSMCAQRIIDLCGLEELLDLRSLRPDREAV